jgi:acyl dehydratase
MIYAPRDVVVTPRMALAYAAGMGLLDDRHLNDADGARLCVAPTLCVSLEWMISGDSRNRASLGLSDEERARAVHAGQDTRFLRPLPVNAPLVVSGEVAGLSSTRAGARLTSVLRVSDKSSDEVISESRIDTIFRGVSTDAPPASPAGGGEAQPAVRSELMREQLFPISRGFPHIYTECASIWNPIHTERRAALAAGLPDIIVHGTALWALGYVALNRPGWRLSRLAGRFSAMAIPGQSVRLRHSGDHDSGFAFEVLNAAGDRAVSAGAVEFEMET